MEIKAKSLIYKENITFLIENKYYFENLVKNCHLGFW